MIDKTFWYYIVSFKSRKTNEFSYEDGVFKGSFTGLVFFISRREDLDDYYAEFILINWKKITQEEFEFIGRKLVIDKERRPSSKYFNDLMCLKGTSEGYDG